MDALIHGADYNHEQWLDRPEVLDADFPAMQAAGCTAMTVGIFSWSSYEPEEGRFDFGWMEKLLDRLHAHGIKAILATPSGARPAWLSRAYPEVCIMGPDGVRQRHHGRHNHCRSSRAYREQVARIDAELARRFGRHPALALWHVSNEYGSERCYCPQCLGAFREWLEARYGSLAALNGAWWTRFWSHGFSRWEEILPLDASIDGMMLDWARFTSDQTIDFYRAEVRAIRSGGSTAPITTNFMRPDAGLDYWKFARDVDVASWDSYPDWHLDGDDGTVAARTAFFHDFFRSLKGRPFLLMESTPSNVNWKGSSPLKKPGMHLASALQAVAHGSDSVQYFQWRQSRGGEEKFHGAVVGHSGSLGERNFRETAETGRLLGRLSALGVAGSPPAPARVAVVYDLENAWALDLAQLPQNDRKLYQETCLRHYAAFWRAGIACDLMPAADGAMRDLAAYSLIVCPMLYQCGPGFARALGRWAEAGGSLVATYLSGLVDASDLCHESLAPGPLAPVLGVAVEESEALPPGETVGVEFLDGGWAPAPGAPAAPHHAVDVADAVRLEGARAVAAYRGGWLAGTPAMTERAAGRGRAYYIAARTDDAFLDRAYRKIAADAQVAPAWLPLARRLPPGVHAGSRGMPGREVWTLINFSPRPARVELAAGTWVEHARSAVAGLGGDGEVVEGGGLELGAYGVAVLTRAGARP